jgi:hypothetical protein
VPEKILRHGRGHARRHAVPLHRSRLDVRSYDFECPTFPGARRESVPGVLGQLRRMRSSVQPDSAVGVAEETGDRISDQRERSWIDDLVHPEIRTRSAHRIGGRVRLRLSLALRQDRGVPRSGLQPCGIIERNAGVVAQVRTWNPMRLILVTRPRSPFTGQVDLSGCGTRGHQNQKYANHQVSTHAGDDTASSAFAPAAAGNTRKCALVHAIRWLLAPRAEAFRLHPCSP